MDRGQQRRTRSGRLSGHRHGDGANAGPRTTADGQRPAQTRQTDNARPAAQPTPTTRVSTPPFACGRHCAGGNTPCRKFFGF